MTIIEEQNDKIEYLKDHAEKILKYSKKLMQCLEDIDELSEERHADSMRRHRKMDKECEEYSRYY